MLTGPAVCEGIIGTRRTVGERNLVPHISGLFWSCGVGSGVYVWRASKLFDVNIKIKVTFQRKYPK